MRWCRVRLVLLGLLLCVVHVVSGTCAQRFTDPASSALLADVVIEGKVRKIAESRPDPIYNIIVAIRKSILKGAELVNQGLPVRKVTVGRFQNEGSDRKACIGSVQVGRTYFFFLRKTTHPKGLHFEIMAMPVKKTTTVATELRNILCQSCAHKPTISKLTGPDSLPAGTKATLTCAAEAKPNPEFSWYKDGVLLPANRKGRVRIKSRKRQSTLQMKRTTLNDAGVYKCEATNAVGHDSKDFTVKVRHDEPPSLPLKISKTDTTVSNNGHAKPCLIQTYCFNGGTCMFIQEMVDEYCVCPEQWAGRRCELLDAISVRGDYNRQASLLFERTLIIIGIVIAVLVFIIISIASYILAKNRRKRFEQRRKRREAHRRDQHQTAVFVDASNPQARAKTDADRRSENVPSDFSPKQLRQIKLQDSSLPLARLPSHGSSKVLLNQQLSDKKINPDGHQCESNRKLAVSSVYENVVDSNPATFSNNGDCQKCKSTAATVHPESIEMNVLQETEQEKYKIDTREIDYTFVSMNSSHKASLDQHLSQPSQSSESRSSLPHLPHEYHQITETLPKSLEPNLTSSEPLTSSYSSSSSSSQPMLTHQQFQDDASSVDENDTSVQPLLDNHKEHFSTENCTHPTRPFASKSDRELSRYVLLGSMQPTHPNSNGSAVDCQDNNHLLKLSHSNTFPKSKVNGLGSDMYSESDDEDEVQVPYEKQLHISDADLELSEENLNSFFLNLNIPSRQTTREDLVIGLLPSAGLSRPGMRKYQSEDGPAYNKFGNKSFAFLQQSSRSHSLDDPPGAVDDRPDRWKLNSTIAGSPDVETYDNMAQHPAHLYSRMYAYDPNDDSAPWDGDINRTDFSDLAKEEMDKFNKLKDVLPDQQPIPI